VVQSCVQIFLFCQTVGSYSQLPCAGQAGFFFFCLNMGIDFKFNVSNSLAFSFLLCGLYFVFPPNSQMIVCSSIFETWNKD
jgi:hypothetical protein